jgi:hypothetical protein
MNKITTLAAISMFAVIMGMGAFAQNAWATPMPKVDLCHNDDGADGIRGNADDFWEQKSVNGNALDKHIANHFDTSGQHDFEIGVGGTQAECDALILADPNPNP